jgi:hypothetical protein
VLQSFDFSGGKDFAAQGRTFTYQACNAADLGADERIAVEVNGQPLGDFYVGDSITLPQSANRWTVRPYAATLRGYVLIGEGSVLTNRTGGAQAVVSGEVQRVMAGSQFWGIANRQSVAAVYSTCGILCVAGRIALHSVTLHTKGAQQLMMGRTTGKPLANQVLAPVGNKLFSGADSVKAELAGGTSATYPPTTPTDFASFTPMGILFNAGNDRQRLNFNDRGPLVLEAGHGLFAASNTVNLDLGFEVDFEEIA